MRDIYSITHGSAAVVSKEYVGESFNKTYPRLHSLAFVRAHATKEGKWIGDPVPLLDIETLHKVCAVLRCVQGLLGAVTSLEYTW